MNPILLIVAVVAYTLASMLYLSWILAPKANPRQRATIATVIAVITMVVATVLELAGEDVASLPRSAHAIMILTASVGLIFLVVRAIRDVATTGIVVVSLSAAASLALAFKWAAGFDPSPVASAGAITVVHISAAFLGFLLFIPAYILSVFFLAQEHQLKRKTLTGFRFPSLLTLERNAWRLLYIGYPLYTIGILVGLLWQDVGVSGESSSDSSSGLPLQPQHVIAALSWIIYGTAIVRRLRTGWRGKRAALTLMTAFVFAFSAVLLYSMR
jgi:ABC-type uncharacterized transport system permease subunit